MAKKPRAYVSPKAPFEETQETPDTADIQAFRAFSPNLNMLQSAAKSQFDRARANITDSYGAYSGIPSQVARNRMRDQALQEVGESEGLAMAEGSERAQALKLAQLEALANMTARRKRSGYNTQILQEQPGNTKGAVISGAISTAAILA